MYSIGDGVNAYWVFECFAYIGDDNEGNTAAQVMSWMARPTTLLFRGLDRLLKSRLGGRRRSGQVGRL